MAARVYGYTPPSWMTGPLRPFKVNRLPPRERRVLVGVESPTTRAASAAPARGQGGQHVPSGGCEGQASRELAAAGIGSPAQRSGAALIVQINVQGFEQAQSEPQVRAVFAKWSACMRSHGYHYATPLQAGGSPPWNLNAPPSRAEIRAAETDVACKQEVNVLGVRFTAEVGAERVLIARHIQALDEAQSATEAEARGIQRLMARVRSLTPARAAQAGFAAGV